jgi:hypothetical protein
MTIRHTGVTPATTTMMMTTRTENKSNAKWPPVGAISLNGDFCATFYVWTRCAPPVRKFAAEGACQRHIAPHDNHLDERALESIPAAGLCEEEISHARYPKSVESTPNAVGR